ncbi:uncharacterized protein LOC131243057 [Magnolia sinica]|uniref:uncharacterized protein LOC131243057 n=1 Tax=Magnolia sinica TaxID=86752 RepID=UPI0026592849|nr:uncharacterized protein LOC131243057 [Magnolia sinica]
MDLPSNLDLYIHESIQHSVGLPVSSKTLELKLLASEDSRHRLQDRIFLLQDHLKEKDERIERSRAEASLNAQALRKYIEENQRLAAECTELLSQCAKGERECSLYERDREALMEFGNDADERAKLAEIHALEAEENSRRLAEELENYKHECQMLLSNEAKAIEELCTLRQRIGELEHESSQGSGLACSQCSSVKKENQELRSQLLATAPGDSSGVNTTSEGHLLDLVISSMLVKADATRQINVEVAANARSFLEAHTGIEACQGLLKLWDILSPSTKNILALAAEAESLQKDKEHLRINLHRAEEEVKVLFEENNMLDEENKRLLRQVHRERHHQGSDGKHTSSVSAKGKRKSSPKTTGSIMGKVIDFNGPDSPRQPLSPLQHNSPDSKMHRKT